MILFPKSIHSIFKFQMYVSVVEAMVSLPQQTATKACKSNLVQCTQVSSKCLVDHFFGINRCYLFLVGRKFTVNAMCICACILRVCIVRCLVRDKRADAKCITFLTSFNSGHLTFINVFDHT